MSDTNDLVKRLRKVARDEVNEMRENWEFDADPPNIEQWLEWKAADEIERLQRENEKYKDGYKTLLETIQMHVDNISRLEAILDRLADPLYMCSEQEYIDDDTEAEIKARIEYAASHRGKDDE